MILLLTCVFAIAATAGGMLAPNRMQVLVPIVSTASVSELGVPIGHWVAVALWVLAVGWLSPVLDRRRAIVWCIGVGFVLHWLILVALFVPRLEDRAAFSATVYLIYAQVFCVLAVTLSTMWLVHWLRRMRTAPDLMLTLETPLLAGWVALLIAVVRYNWLMAAAGLAISLLIIGAIRIARRGSLDGLIASIRAMAADERAFLVAIFLVALGLRLLYVTRIMSDANYLDAGADGRVYDELGWSIANGDGIRSTFTASYPLLLLGYVWFIAAVYAVVGHSYFTLTAVQSVLGSVACLLLYDIARALFGRLTAGIAATFAAVSFPLVFAAATIGHQALDVFLTTLLVWLLMRLVGADAAAARWAAAAGVVGGFAFAVRETNVFLMIFLVGWVAIANPRGWRASGPVLTSFVAGAALVVLPFLLPKIWTAADRQAMQGHFDRMYRGEAGTRPTPRAELVGPLANPTAALQQLSSEPGRVVGTLLRAYANNFAVQFLTQPYGGFDPVFLRKGSHYYYAMWFYAYALACAGAILAMRRIPHGGAVASGVILIVGVIAARTFPHLILVSDYRHRVPIEPFLILLASVGAAAMWSKISRSDASFAVPAR